MIRIGFMLLCLACAPVAFALPFEDELHLPVTQQTHRVTQLVALDPGITFAVLDVDGPGCVRHIWMTIGENVPRGIVLRMYWDGEVEPSVESPLSDFFGVGHNLPAPEQPFATPLLVVAPKNGYNIYFPMPFRTHARITVTNEQDEALADGGGVYFQADYVTYAELPVETPYFHAQWRREAPATRRGRPYDIVQAVGKGFLAGVTLHVRTDDTSDKWFHGGGDYTFIDGDNNPNLIKGIGGEDFFGQSWHSSRFISPYAGSTHHQDDRVSMYRFFVESPIHFERSIRFAYGALENEITSVGYWYQTEPHQRFTRFPDYEHRLPESSLDARDIEIELEEDLQVNVAVLGPFYAHLDSLNPLDGLSTIDTNLSLLTNYLLPYKHVVPDEDNRPVRWERARTVLSWLDFDAYYKPKIPKSTGIMSMPDTVNYVYIQMLADGARTCQLFLGHDDPLRIWLNGEQVSEMPIHHGFASSVVDLSLREGRNDLLIKVANTWNANFAANALAIRFRDTQGIRFATFDSLPLTPERAANLDE